VKCELAVFKPEVSTPLTSLRGMTDDLDIVDAGDVEGAAAPLK